MVQNVRKLQLERRNECLAKLFENSALVLRGGHTQRVPVPEILPPTEPKSKISLVFWGRHTQRVPVLETVPPTELSGKFALVFRGRYTQRGMLPPTELVEMGYHHQVNCSSFPTLICSSLKKVQETLVGTPSLVCCNSQLLSPIIKFLLQLFQLLPVILDASFPKMQRFCAYNLVFLLFCYVQLSPFLKAGKIMGICKFIISFAKESSKTKSLPMSSSKQQTKTIGKQSKQKKHKKKKARVSLFSSILNQSINFLSTHPVILENKSNRNVESLLKIIEQQNFLIADQNNIIKDLQNKVEMNVPLDKSTPGSVELYPVLGCTTEVSHTSTQTLSEVNEGSENNSIPPLTQMIMAILHKMMIPKEKTLAISLKDFPKFNGMVPELIYEFFEKFENILSLRKCPDESFMSYLRFSLVGYAKVVFNEICLPGMSYSEIKDALVKYFFHPDFMFKIHQQTNNMQQKAHQSLEKYYLKLKRLGKVLKYGLTSTKQQESLNVHNFIKGLQNKAMSDYVSRKEPKTMEEAFHEAKKEQSMNYNQSWKRKVRNRRVSPRIRCNSCQKRGHPSHVCRRK